MRNLDESKNAKDMSALSKLSELTKQELLDAIKELQRDNPRYQTLIINILAEHDAARHRKLFETSQKTSKKMIESLKAWAAFKNEMVTKYGDGKSVNIPDIPKSEIDSGAQLEKNYRDAVRKDIAARMSLEAYYRNKE